MNPAKLTIGLNPLPGAMPAWHGETYALKWDQTAQRVRDHGGFLVSLWGSDDSDRGQGCTMHVAYAASGALACLSLPLGQHRTYPDLSPVYPAAVRMQRAVKDLLGLQASGSRDTRPWLRHGAWAAGEAPLRKGCAIGGAGTQRSEPYAFVPVSGDGVHEIPVGPVHAGTIEPGHFRFHVVGERILRLEERLGYTHKGIEKLFETCTLDSGARLAARISGDSTVAYAWAYAMAVEGVTGTEPPARAVWMRALLLERERIANHLGDLGALGNDAGFAFGLTQFSLLKEDMLRVNESLFGHRYLMDAVIPGGVRCDLRAADIDRLRHEADTLERAVAALRAIYDEHAGLQDRFIKAGVVTPELALKLGLCGLAGRASGIAWDARVDLPCRPYDELSVRAAVHRNGDVAARVNVRFEEVFESLRITRLLLGGLPGTESGAALRLGPDHAFGVGMVEGWRGPVFIALHAGAANRIHRLHPHDPSWQNWPVLEHAVIGNIVPDFPLINKSFNLAYSGHDL
ncbi:MAG: NADH-quinone oxidoreductase subunit C [Gammaproteobacteria bacterium]